MRRSDGLTTAEEKVSRVRTGQLSRSRTRTWTYRCVVDESQCQGVSQVRWKTQRARVDASARHRVAGPGGAIAVVEFSRTRKIELERAMGCAGWCPNGWGRGSGWDKRHAPRRETSQTEAASRRQSGSARTAARAWRTYLGNPHHRGGVPGALLSRRTR